jgi:polar amino acid transport system substrate-binding protein
LYRLAIRNLGPRSVFALAILGLSVALAACGGSDTVDDSATSSASVDKQVAALLPADVRQNGTILAATDATYPPNEFIGEDGKTIVGMGPDLAAAMSKVLGVKIVLRNTPYDSIIPAIAGGKYDMVLSSMTDTKERQATLDFVDYFKAGTSFYSRQDGPAFTGLADLCGKHVAAQKATTQQSDAEAQAKKCKEAGKPPLTPLLFPDQNAVNLSLASGRADVAMADSPVASYQAKLSNGKFKLVGKTYGTAPYGIGVKKGSPLVKPLRAALSKLIEDGTYQKIVAKWGNQAGAISSVTVNAATF